ncbi:hypothetical protein SLS53_001321 [Cytospora paraplurivora]|uniref:Rik1-associated factor 1 n=1 Tax=Cytospora paraplurivora TaxID=2898453 RepID=A0AAN9YML2_9PEZI
MAVPNRRSIKEVIDLTGDVDNDSAPPRPKPQTSRALTNGRPRVNGNRVGGHAPAPTPVHTHSHSTGNDTLEPAAKRQRLSEDPRPKTYKTTWNAQHVAAFTEARLWPYAKAAAEFIRDTLVDKGKLRSEVQNALLNQYGGLINEAYAGNIPLSLHSDIDTRAKVLAKNFASLPPEALTRTFTNLTEVAEPQIATPLVAQPSQIADPWASQVLRTTDGLPARAKTPPASSRKTRSAVTAPTSPANFRSRAKVAAWKSEDGKAKQDRTKKPLSSYFSLNHRPYVDAVTKESILKSNGRLLPVQPDLLEKPKIFHVDFALDEARKVQAAVRQALNRSSGEKKEDPYRDLSKLLKKLKDTDRVARHAEQIQIEGRRAEDIQAFFRDLLQKRALVKEPQMLSVEKDDFDKRDEDLRESRLSSLLLAREMTGNRGLSMRRLENFTNEFHKNLEDRLELRAEFTNCAGDISTVSWVSDTAYIAGTTVHMDSHNQQYNKPGNLLLGTASLGTSSSGTVSLKAYPDHRIPRPLVQKGENSTDEMRESQDPWLYTSVVSSDYDAINGRTYTSGFDRTVKIWKIKESDPSMTCLGTWKHDGIVNFVQATRLESPTGLVATASDVPVDAVRIYQVNPSDVSNSPYTSLSASRIRNADGTPLITDKWAYFPSTMKWGIEESVKHLLLVGFSPRSLKDDDSDIPPDRLNTGEICLWDSINGERVRITSANSQNVFEVLWHPSQPAFVMASSPTGNNIDIDVRTQVRIFTRTKNADHGFVFSEVKALDCPAIDINELTFMPNSPSYCYVTAGCTDGKTYVWDSALSDKPIHTLAHGPPLEGVTAGDDEDDTGVKFTAWGTSLDRFYTGSSDGVVKVWNVRAGGKKAKGRVILEAPAQISYGAFSPDFSKLVIGDASGRVFILSVDADEERPASFISLPGARGGARRRPTPITPHPEPPPPPGALEGRQTGVALGRAYLARRQLRYSGDQTVGMVQDVNYAETGLFRKEAHAKHDPGEPCLANYECRQQENVKAFSNPALRTRRLRKLTWVDEDDEEDDAAGRMDMDGAYRRSEVMRAHAENCRLDLELEGLSSIPEIRDVLAREGVGPEELREGVFDPESDFVYIDEVDETCKRGVVERRKEDDDALGY